MGQRAREVFEAAGGGDGEMCGCHPGHPFAPYRRGCIEIGRGPPMSGRSWGARLLLPLMPVYQWGLGSAGMAVEARLGDVRRLRYPVISVGNLSAGGSGKTPL